MARIEQMEMDRLNAVFEPVLDEHLRTMSPLVTEPGRSLVMMGVLLRQAARVAQRLGMSKEEFDKRVLMITKVAWEPRIEVPTILG